MARRPPGPSAAPGVRPFTVDAADSRVYLTWTRYRGLLHSLDGRYVFVGDSGDVIDTSTRAVITQIPDLHNSRHGYLELDWSGGQPIATTTHFGVGRS